MGRFVKRSAQIFFVLFIIVLNCHTVLAAEEISGTISLPPGVGPFAADLSVDVFLLKNWNGSYFEGSFYCGSVSIPAYTSSAPYSCVDSTAAGVVSIEVDVWGYDDLWSYNYYNSSGTISQSWQAEHLTAETVHTDIDVELLGAITISGQIQTPYGETFGSDKDISVIVEYFTNTGEAWPYYSSSYGAGTLLAGQSVITYEIRIPASGGLVKILYDFGGWSEPPEPGYMEEGYYSSSGTQYERAAGDFLDTNSPRADINMTLLEAVILAGSVSLPNGDTNSTDVNVDIYFSDINTYETLAQATVVVPAGINSADFNLNVPPGKVGRLYYYLYSNTDTIYFDQGYYSTSGMVAESWAASPIDTSAPPGQIDVVLIPGIVFSGTIATPSAETFAETIEGNINIYTDDETYLGGTWYSIIPGSSETTWELIIPEGQQNIVLNSYLYKWNFDPGPQYLSQSFYHSTGSVGLFQNAERLDGMTGQTDIIFPLLVGNEVSGTFSLQDSDSFATDGDIYLNVSWIDEPGDGWFYGGQFVDFSAGAYFVDFSLFVPPDAPDYILNYSWWTAPAPYIHYGYYAPTQDGFCESDAFIFSGGLDHPGTDITLLTGKTVQGDISLPSGLTEPEELQVSLGAVSVPENGNYHTTLLSPANFTIPADTNSAPYELVLPVTCEETPASYSIGYQQPSDNYVRSGYYSDSGTVGLISNAAALANDQDHTGINLELIAGTGISGTLSLPAGVTAPAEGLAVTLGTISQPTDLYHTTVTIGAGLSDASYLVRVAPDVGVTALSYWLPEEAPYATRGFFSTTVGSPDNTTGRYDYADLFDTAQASSGNNFTLSFGQQVSGTIFSPEAAAGDTPVHVILAADPDNPDSVYWHDIVKIPHAESSVAYSRRVLLDSDIFVKYKNNRQPNWSPFGYFLDEFESTRLYDQATFLSAGTDHPDTHLYIEEMFGGDLNNDGTIDLADAVIGLQILTGQSIPFELAVFADVNNDGVLGMAEVLSVLAALQN